jgi:hypothetical protein
MGQWQSKNVQYIVKIHENKKLLFRLNLKLGIRLAVRLMFGLKVRFRFKIRLYDFVNVPASDYPTEPPAVHESSQ